MQVDADGLTTLAAVAVCLAAPIIRTWVRWSVQLAILAAVVVTAVAADAPPTRIGVSTTLLLGVVVVASTFAADLHRARDGEFHARAAAQRRARLLDRVRQLPGRDVATAAHATVAALRAMGFDSAGVALRHGRALEVVHLEGSQIPDWRIPEGHGLSWRAMTQGRTIVSEDYSQDPARLPGRVGVRSAILSPIRGPDEPLGVVMCGRGEPHSPTDEEVEIVEICADHLGAVIATDRQLLRQRELLRRMHRLESMRAGFVGAVSTELREQLVAARDATRVLAADHLRMPASARRRMLEDLRITADELRTTIDALLDFSAFQREHRDDLEVLDADELAAALASWVEVRRAGAPDASTTDPPDVAADPALLGRALELLADADRPAILLAVGGVGVTLEPIEPALVHPLVRALAEQLIVSGGGELAGDGAWSIQIPRITPDEGRGT